MLTIICLLLDGLPRATHLMSAAKLTAVHQLRVKALLHGYYHGELREHGPELSMGVRADILTNQ